MRQLSDEKITGKREMKEEEKEFGILLKAKNRNSICMIFIKLYFQ